MSGIFTQGRKGAVMEARAKSSGTPYPIWVYGEYLTEPPKRPNGALRPVGHYIDKGGYPGANVYAVDISTLCKSTAAVDGRGSRIYTQDILLHEAEDEIGYFVVEDEETAVDVVWGEIVALGRLQAGDISIVGNTVDYPDFIEGMRYHVENGLNVPYLPSLDVMATPLPFLKMTCLKCGYVTLGCRYVARHKDCGGFFTMDFATKIYRKGEKEKAFA